MRFIQNQYPSYFKLNGMLGFCVSSFDINVNISNINDHLTKWCIAHTQQHISKLSYVDGFEYTYTSYHTLEKETDKKIRLYHTMLDFSTLIDL
jgi:hypothetical protein